jgi:hypothetical protein
MDFSQRIVRAVPGGFDKHGGDDVLIRRVAPVVIDQLISPYRGKIAERLNRASGGAKPRMPVHAEIPKMAMCVDDRSAGTVPPRWKLRGSGVVRDGRRVSDRRRSGFRVQSRCSVRSCNASSGDRVAGHSTTDSIERRARRRRASPGPGDKGAAGVEISRRRILGHVFLPFDDIGALSAIRARCGAPLRRPSTRRSECEWLHKRGPDRPAAGGRRRRIP